MPACRYCQKERAEADFYPTGKPKPDGTRYLSRKCRMCHTGASRMAYRARGADRVGGLVGRLLGAAKRRATEKGLEFSLTPSDVVIPETCPVLGIRLSTDDGDWNNSPSLDRIDPKKGYTPDNVRVISFRANRIKCDATVAEVEAILAYMKNP